MVPLKKIRNYPFNSPRKGILGEIPPDFTDVFYQNKLMYN